MATVKKELATKLASAALVFDEVKYEQRLKWDFDDAREAAYRAASGVARIGPLAALLAGPLVLLVIAMCVNRDINNGGTVLCLVAFLVGRLYVIAVGTISGRIAHRFAYRTDVSAISLAKSLAWVVNLSLWVWIVVITVKYMQSKERWELEAWLYAFHGLTNVHGEVVHDLLA